MRLFLIALALIFAPLVSHANKHMSDAEFAKMKRELNLTAAQSKSIDEIHNSSKGQFQALEDRKDALKDQFKDAFVTARTDSELRKLHNEMADVKEDMDKLKFENKMAIRKVLTAEQRRKLISMKESEHKEKEMDRD